MHHLKYLLQRAAPRVLIHEKKDAIKQIYLFLASFFREQMLCICPQQGKPSFGGALVPLRGGS